MPRCYKCKQERPEEEFAKNAYKDRGIDDECRTCKNVYKKDWSSKNKGKRLVTKTNWREKHPESDADWNRIRRERRAQAKLNNTGEARVGDLLMKLQDETK